MKKDLSSRGTDGQQVHKQTHPNYYAIAYHSAGDVYSFGLCETPSFDGTKIIDVGHTAEVEQLSNDMRDMRQR